MYSIFLFLTVCCVAKVGGVYSADLEFTIDLETKDTKCPCKNPNWCKTITDTSRKEIFIFSLNNKKEIWSAYNWTKVTTVVIVGYTNPEVMCLAHANGARAVVIGSMPVAQLTNRTARSQFIQNQLKVVTDNYLDGINIDFEDPITLTEQRKALTSLLAELYKAFKSHDPHLQVTVDVAWSPNCIDNRCYDYVGLSKNSDFMFVMSYDEQSQIYGPCVAGANSGYFKTRNGLNAYIDLNIPVNKLVLGIPWYGYTYKCLSLSEQNVCQIPKVPFRGVNCSDAAGQQRDYHVIMDILKNSTTGRLWDDSSLSPYFNYKKGNDTYQLRYDDPESLDLKYNMVRTYQLRGVGMWNADAVNYTSDDPEVKRQTFDMWNKLPDFGSK